VSGGPLIVQSDKTLLLEIDHPDAQACRMAIAPFAELERSPEHVHTYRLTPLGLWNARAAGHDAEGVVDALIKYSRYPVPHALLVDVAETMDRYGRLQLANDPAHGLVLRALDRVVLVEVAKSKKLAGMLGNRIDDDTIAVHPSERGRLKQALLKLGWPAEDLAGYVDGEAHRSSWPRPARTVGSRGRCGRTSGRRWRRSGPAARVWWCCPAGPVRRWSARRRWPRRRPPR
jgi:DNA excision repair protein ERCC-3